MNLFTIIIISFVIALVINVLISRLHLFNLIAYTKLWLIKETLLRAKLPFWGKIKCSITILFLFGKKFNAMVDSIEFYDDDKENPNQYKMKKLIRLIIVIAIFGVGLYYCTHNPEPQTPVVQTAATMTKVYNGTKDTVTVYVTLGATPGCLQNVMNVAWVTDSVPGQRGLQGTFTLLPGDSTAAYAPDSLGFNGVISFNSSPNNCPDTCQFPTGVNQYEFMINNAYQGTNAQESINISCVHGVNCVILVSINTLNPFNAGPTVPNISDFSNTLDRNAIIAGVYPYGCDTCTGSKTLLPCITYPQPAHKNSDCQVQRNAAQSGGLIKVMYLGQQQPLK